MSLFIFAFPWTMLITFSFLPLHLIWVQYIEMYILKSNLVEDV